MTPWHEWEDWLAGLYVPTYAAEQVAHSRRLLLDVDQFREVAREMVREWPRSAEHNLQALWTGRNAWVGQASCLYAHGAPRAATCEAWGTLSVEEQASANRVAVRVRDEWGVSRGCQTLF